MACKCKDENLAARAQVSCDEPEESFRSAYNRTLQLATQATAQKNELQARYDLLEQKIRITLTSLEQVMNRIEAYAKAAVAAMPADVAQNFQKRNGVPPSRLKVG